MALHPLSHFAIASAFAVLAAGASPESGPAVVLFALAATAAIPRRTDTELLRPFLKLLTIALLFLFLIHGVSWRPLGITRAGLLAAAGGFVHIAIPITAMLHLSRQVRAEELYSFLIDLRVPPGAILVLFRTIWLVPRLIERMEETVAALRLRGMPTGTFRGRFQALAPSLGVVFSSMFAEISDNAAVMASRGFLRTGRRTHFLPLPFHTADAGTVAVCLILTVLAWW